MDMTEALVGEGLDELGKMTERAQRLGSQLGDLTVEETGADGLIRVVVGPGARLHELTIDPRAMRMSSESLAVEIVGAFDAAFDAYQARMMEIVGDVVGDSALDNPFAPPGDPDDVVLNEEGLKRALSEVENTFAQLRANLR